MIRTWILKRETWQLESSRNSSIRLEGTSRNEVLASHETVIMISFWGASDVENSITL